MADRKIVYPIVPSRFTDEKWDKILDFIREEGCTPFDHRRGTPFSDFEFGIGREKTLRFMINIMRQCDAAWIFGVSEGCLGELNSAFYNGMEISGFYNFDPEWEKYYGELKQKYADPIARIRGENRLIAVVGSRAVGKTYWIDHLIRMYDDLGILRRIRNTTTRKPRDNKDHLYYNFFSKEEFRRDIKARHFLDHDTHYCDYYGFSI